METSYGPTRNEERQSKQGGGKKRKKEKIRGIVVRKQSGEGTRGYRREGGNFHQTDLCGGGVLSHVLLAGGDDNDDEGRGDTESDGVIFWLISRL